VETSTLPVIWTLTKTPDLFLFFFKKLKGIEVATEIPQPWGNGCGVCLGKAKQEKYYFIIKVLSMCFESTHHELITRWAKQNKRNSSNDKHQKRMIRKAI